MWKTNVVAVPVVIRCSSLEQGTPTTQDWTSCPVTLSAGTWRLVINALGHQGAYTGATLTIDGVLINNFRNSGIGDTSGTGYTPLHAVYDTAGNRTAIVTGWWNASTGKYADREILISAFKM